MKPMSEQHFAILRRHMVELIGMHMDLMSDELGKSTLDDRVAAGCGCERHLRGQSRSWQDWRRSAGVT